MEKPRALPRTPGIYQFLDTDGAPLYIGKANNIKSRIQSHFSSNDAKTKKMREEAARLETITTRNEVEALLLEAQLIQEHKPKYNIMLRDSRRYAWIIITEHDYPRILTARDKRRKGKYYGPYTDGTARRRTVIALTKAFKLRTCRTLPKRVCLQYHIGNCTGPCEGHDTKESYNARIKDAQAVLEGRTRPLLQRLASEMREHAANQRFEEAKKARDAIAAIKELETMQVVEREESADQDVISYARGDEETVFVVLQVRRGVIAKKNEYRVPVRDGIHEEFLTALYRERIPPGEIITEQLQEHSWDALEEYLSTVAHGTVKVTCPQRGEKRRLLELARENAEQAKDADNASLTSLQEHLNLSAPPQTIDCFDVSTHQGTETVAASVRYRHGRPDPSAYRRFNIRSAVHDDFAAMAEAVSRRYREDALPDLIVIDGGKGQLSAAREALAGRGTIPIIALAKKEEEIYVPGLRFPLKLPRNDPGLLLLRRIRDATHRYVITHHRGRRRRALTESVLDHIDGIGPKRKKRLYQKFQTFTRITEASLDDLQAVVGKKTGKKLHEELHS